MFPKKKKNKHRKTGKWGAALAASLMITACGVVMGATSAKDF